jgi:hypothetical protein
VAKIDVTQVEGFDQLNEKLKRLDDKVKRSEIIKIQRRVAKPLEKAYAEALPKKSGTLAKSVSTKAVPKSKTGGNPSIVIRPGKKGKNDGYYKFMVVKKGARLGSNRRGSRKGKNTVVEDARDVAIRNVGPQAQKEALDKTADYIQKQITRLSTP